MGTLLLPTSQSVSMYTAFMQPHCKHSYRSFSPLIPISDLRVNKRSRASCFGAVSLRYLKHHLWSSIPISVSIFVSICVSIYSTIYLSTSTWMHRSLVCCLPVRDRAKKMSRAHSAPFPREKLRVRGRAIKKDTFPLNRLKVGINEVV